MEGIALVIQTLCILWSCSLLSTSVTYQHVETKKGTIKGKRLQIKGKLLDVFYGIPYAKPPIKHRRFKHPVPIDPWQGTKDTTELPNACMQVRDETFPGFHGSEMWNPNTEISEDCLYLNVWSPVGGSKNKSVMVWIYGGSFLYGSISLDVYNAKYLAVENDVVVVSMQYRLGSLGFFVSEVSEQAPGNAGLFDQMMALDWVQENIRNFRGSRDSVTLFGESAGAASIGLHLVSPLSRLKFNRAVLQSGGPQAAWTAISKKEAINRGKKLAFNVGCKSNSPSKLVECLRNVNATRLAENDLISTSGILQFPFVPIVDGSFLLERPDLSVIKGNFKRCEILLGSNTNEGSYFLVYSQLAFQSRLFNKSHNSLISRDNFLFSIDKMFSFFPSYPTQNTDFIKDAIKFQYTPWINPTDEELNRNSVEQAVGDWNFVCPTVDLAKYYTEFGEKVYYYLFNHRASQNKWGAWMGVMHGDEIMFVFGQPLDSSQNYTSHEKRLSKKMMKYWSNFAKSGDPNRDPELKHVAKDWPLHTLTDRKHIILDTSYLSHRDLPHQSKKPKIGSAHRVHHCAFWREYLLRTLLNTTANMTELEREWKLEYYDWKNTYMVQWKKQFDSFVNTYEKRIQSCTAP